MFMPVFQAFWYTWN